MAALPVYHVEFIPLERRLGERRAPPVDGALPRSVQADRRRATGRRAEDRQARAPKTV